MDDVSINLDEGMAEQSKDYGGEDQDPLEMA
jgi:hypothetical protein